MRYAIMRVFTLKKGGCLSLMFKKRWAEGEFMAGTKAGGLKAAATNKAKYGDNFYARIGAQGGKNGHTGGFAANKALARIAGAKGGRLSKRGPAKKKVA